MKRVGFPREMVPDCGEPAKDTHTQPRPGLVVQASIPPAYYRGPQTPTRVFAGNVGLPGSANTAEKLIPGLTALIRTHQAILPSLSDFEDGLLQSHSLEDLMTCVRNSNKNSLILTLQAANRLEAASELVALALLDSEFPSWGMKFGIKQPILGMLLHEMQTWPNTIPAPSAEQVDRIGACIGDDAARKIRALIAGGPVVGPVVSSFSPQVLAGHPYGSSTKAADPSGYRRTSFLERRQMRAWQLAGVHERILREVSSKDPAQGRSSKDDDEVEIVSRLGLPVKKEPAIQPPPASKAGEQIEIVAPDTPRPGQHEPVLLQVSSQNPPDVQSSEDGNEARTVSPSGVQVKQEPAVQMPPAARPVETIEIIPLDTSRDRVVHHKTVVRWEEGPDGQFTEGAMTISTPRIVMRPQSYDQELEKVFPLRDPRNPVLVNPEYADDRDKTRCASSLTVEKLELLSRRGGSKGSGMLEVNDLWNAVRKTRNIQFKTMRSFGAALVKSCQAEIEATMRGHLPPSTGKAEVVRITERSQCESDEEFAALKGQYGVVLKNYDRQLQPTLQNGQILGCYAGVLLDSPEADQAYAELYGDEIKSRSEKAYGVTFDGNDARMKGYVVDIVPYGGGNMWQFCNTSMKADPEGGAKLVVDSERCNAVFIPVKVTFNKHGWNEQLQEVLIMFGLTRPLLEGEQIKIDYGPDFLHDPQEATVDQLIRQREGPVLPSGMTDFIKEEPPRQ